MGHYDSCREADYDEQRRYRAEQAGKHGPLLLTKVNTLLHGSNVRCQNVEKKQRELRDAVVIWMYDQGALTGE